ncbi:MAG TPA: hypothetical protein VLD37_06115 [Candidatus Bilamarchaeum sp.]|nr:hypothetical protein [Candidatus Bilamarchaeum sp.]
MAQPRSKQQQQPPVDIDKMRDQLTAMRGTFLQFSQMQPLPRQDLETMRTDLQRMQADLAGHVRRFPNQQRVEALDARRRIEGLLADLDHLLNYQYPAQPPQQNQPPAQQQGQQPPQQQPQPRGRPQRRQQTPALPVPRRVPAPPRTMTYDVVIGPLPNQRFQLTLPPGETIQSLYGAAVQRGQVVDREYQAGALTLDGNPVTPQYIPGQIPPAEVPATPPSQGEMLRSLLAHNCFTLPPVRSPAGGDYTSGGQGFTPGFDVQSVAQFPDRSQRLDQFRDDVVNRPLGAPLRVAQALQGPATQQPGTQPGLRRRRGG